MGKAILAFVLSAGLGIWFSFFNKGIGIVICISIIGAFLIYQKSIKMRENEIVSVKLVPLEGSKKALY